MVNPFVCSFQLSDLWAIRFKFNLEKAYNIKTFFKVNRVFPGAGAHQGALGARGATVVSGAECEQSHSEGAVGYQGRHGDGCQGGVAQSEEKQAAAAALQARGAAGLARAQARAQKHAQLQAARLERAKQMYEVTQPPPFSSPHLARPRSRACTRAPPRPCQAAPILL